LDRAAHLTQRILAFSRRQPLTPQRVNLSTLAQGLTELIRHSVGEKVEITTRLSGTGSVLCATCHAPFRHFQDARARAFGLELVDRNTPSIVDARFHRWFGWDGAQDSLWAQSIRPLLDPREMKANAAHIAGTMRTLFPRDYEQAFGRPVPQSDEEVLVDTGKALAAFQETQAALKPGSGALAELHLYLGNSFARLDRYADAALLGDLAVGEGRKPPQSQ
jgi:cytochrome c peroxidase